MTAQKPDVAPREGDYDALRQRVIDAAEAARTNNAASQGLAAPQLLIVIRAASEGVLRQLQEHGIGEAGTLAIKLGAATETDENADLSYTVSTDYKEREARREISVDANAQAQQRRMALLASAAGETAVAVVGSVLNPGQLAPLVENGRVAVTDYNNVAHGNVGATLLRGLLDQTEAAVSQDEQTEPRAAA